MIIAIFLIAELLTFAFLLTSTPLYTSTSTILIEREAPEVLESKRLNDEGESSAETFYATQYQMLRSRSLAAGVIRDRDLEYTPEFTGAGQKPSLVAAVTGWARSIIVAAGGWVQSWSAAVRPNKMREPILGVQVSGTENLIRSAVLHAY